MVILVVIVTGLLVWHFTRASQAHQAIQSRRAQIRTLWQEVGTFAMRGLVALFVFLIVIVVALKKL